MSKIELYNSINRILDNVGFDIIFFPGMDQRLSLKYLQDNKIENCFDIGTHTGQYAKNLLTVGFIGNIFYLNPKKAFDQLSKSESNHANWTANNMGLGITDGKSAISISKNLVSRSLLGINKVLTDTVQERVFFTK